MHAKRVLFFLLLLAFSFKAYSAIFVVTSNADSGPGTLRDALTLAAANGSAVKDYINFNLLGSTAVQKIITLITPLPDVTGNVVIDGTTQPGVSLGVSNAKITITTAVPATGFNAFNVSSQVGPNDAVEFYGLYIEGFEFNYSSGIAVNSDCKLVVGAPGKGNVLCGNWCGIYGDLNNSLIQSNFVGIEPDGETAFLNQAAGIGANIFFNNLIIGGDIQADGNIIVGGENIGIDLGSGDGESSMQNATIKNNYLGTDYQGKKAVRSGALGSIEISDTNNVLISQNVFSASSAAIAASYQATLVITGNYFGTDKTQTIQLGSRPVAITLNDFVNSTIGGDADVDQNIFTNYANPILSLNFSATNIIKNKFYCNQLVAIPDYYKENYVRITKLFDNEVSGDAPPGATVQLYYSMSKCTSCNPNIWFATVTANSSGVWDYSGDTKQNVMASSTVDYNTIGFQPESIGPDEVTIINKDCHHKGSIEIIEKRLGRFQFIWKSNSGQVIGTDQKIDGLDPGVYTLEINEGGNCPAATGTFTVIDLTPHVNSQTFQLNCDNVTGNLDASFTTATPDITVAKYYWSDESGKIISNESSITNLAAGKYYLYITDSNGCNSDKQLYQVLPPVAIPLIDITKVTVTDANCNSADGSITGLSVSNINSNLYGWSSADGMDIIYYQLNLKNVKAGQYFFFIQYSFNCPSVKSALFTVKSANGITLDESNAVTTIASCSKNNGSVTGIKIDGATQYQWLDAHGKVIASTPDLQNAAAGDYTLTAYNSYGCSETSKPYHIGQQLPTQFPVYANVITSSCFGDYSGSVSVTTDALVKSLRWQNSQGQTISTAADLTNVATGAYQLYLTDQNGCESLYESLTVPQLDRFTVVQAGQVASDQCGLKTGSVTATTVSGGLPPYTYKWVDAGGVQIGSGSGITNLSKGSYTLNIIDSKCGNIDIDYTINEQTEDITAPSVNNAQLCSSGTAVLTVNNPVTSFTYRLYDSQTSTQPLDEQPGGNFTVNVINSRSYFISQLTGTCESSRAEVKVTVGISALNIINAFTPNGDGINDYWKITGIENYPDATVRVFNRYGQKEYDSKGYAVPFNGKSGGKLLPAGVYYYIINLSNSCNLLSGSLTIIR